MHTLDLAIPASTTLHRMAKHCLSLLGVLFWLTSGISAHAVQSFDHDIKVAFLHNMVKFVEWPQPLRADVPLRLCVLGAGPFGEAAAVLRGKAAGATVWEVVPVNLRSSLRECAVLLISASEAGNLRQVLESIKGGAVLTAGDSGNFAEQGVIVNFYLEENKVRFEINLDAARRAGVKISSQLLKLARIVRDGGAP